MARPFDPLQRARDFPRMPSPRRLLLSTERRLDGLERSVGMAIDLAVQPQGNTPIRIVQALPEATSDDLGEQLILQLPGETLTQLYAGVLGPDDVVFWQLLAGGVSAGGGTSPEFTFVANVITGIAHQGVWEEASKIWMCNTGESQIRFYDKNLGGNQLSFAISNAIAVTKDASGNFYMAQPGSIRIRKYNSVGTLQDTTTTSKTYNSVYHRLGAGHILATSAVNNEWYKINLSNMDTLNTVSASISAPQGICEDSAGNIYVANTGANTIRKYNPSLTFVDDWGSAGSGDGQFSTIKQMWVDDSDRIYVADSGNDRIQVFDASGTFLGKFGSSGTGVGQLDGPTSVHGLGTSICVADTGNARASRWTRT